MCVFSRCLSTVLSVRCATVLSPGVYYASAPLISLLSLSLLHPLFQPGCHLHHLWSALGVHLLLTAVAWVISIASPFLRSLPLDSPTRNPAPWVFPFLLPLGCSFLSWIRSFHLHCTPAQLPLSLPQCLSFSSSWQGGSQLLSSPSLEKHCSL